MFMFVTHTSVVNGGGHGRVRDFVGLCVTLCDFTIETLGGHSAHTPRGGGVISRNFGQL